MHRFRSFRYSIRHALAALLLLALLSAQWSGLQHRIEHAWQESVSVQLIDDDGVGIHVAHSCKLFDAATLGIGLHTAVFTAPCSRLPVLSPVHLKVLSWQALFIRHFSSRAPPS